MLKCMTAVLLAIELFAASFIQIPIGIVKKEQARSSYSDAVFGDVLGDSSNKDLSVQLHTQLAFSHTTAAEIKEPPSVVYEDTIFITNLNQLLAIGSDQAVTDTDMTEDGFGRGKPLSYSDGTPAV